jgi:hypothetical protein
MLAVVVEELIPGSKFFYIDLWRKKKQQQKKKNKKQINNADKFPFHRSCNKLIISIFLSYLL